MRMFWALKAGYLSLQSVTDPQAIFVALPLAVAVIGIIYGAYMALWVLKQDAGTDEMKHVSSLISIGARAFLSREYRTILPVGGALAFIVWLVYYSIIRSAGLAAVSASSFALGALGSALAGYIGMYITTRSASRTAQAARKSGLGGALKVSFRAGSVMGTMLASIGLLVVSSLFFLISGFRQWGELLIPVAFGASLISLFMRVAGGIYTKAADWGSDIVGKVEVGIPEDDPRNPGTIADNVGDNVGDVAGMSSDVYESLIVVLTGSMFISYVFGMGSGFSLLPLYIAALTLLSTLIGIQLVRGKVEDAEEVMSKLNRSLYFTAGLSMALFLIAVAVMFGLSALSITLWLTASLGMLTTIIILHITEYFTHYTHGPVRNIARQSAISASNVIVTGYSYGLLSAVPVILTVSAVLGISYALGELYITYPSALAGGIYGTAIASTGLLSMAGIVITLDSFGPVSDNASGLAEMTGLSEEARKHTDVLDAVGNTTKATTKGYAIASAGLAAVVLFIGFVYEVVRLMYPALHAGQLIAIAFSRTSVLSPQVIIGSFLGAVLVYLFSSRTLSSVSRTAMELVEEIRRQFRENPGILKGEQLPDYSRAIDIVTRHALSEFMLPGLLAVIMPVVVGAVLGWEALVGLILGTIAVGLPRAILMANAGGAWDNAKKYIESGADPALGGKGTEAHKNAVVGDVVGDPFKDTTGPSINPLIKVVNTVSVVFSGAIVLLNKALGLSVSLVYIAHFILHLLIVML
ncbi:MAG: sodium-translocating pyrophosphatase [Nitrososphaeria archaeon]